MTIEQTRSYAYKHPHIVSLGKSSTYAIDKWELYTGTIRDLLYDILLNEKEPMTAEELYNEVALIYPNTNIKIYKDFEDRRKAYFEDLIEFLYTYGFEV